MRRRSQAHRPEGQDGHARADRQPHASPARRHDLAAGAEMGRRLLAKKAIELLRARAKRVGPGEWVFNIGGWATAQFADDPKPFTREELDRIAPDNPVALQESYYQVFLNSRGSEGVRDRAERARPAGLRQGVDHARRRRQADRRDQRRHRRDASRRGETSQGGAGPARSQQSGAGQGHESSRPHLVRRGRLQRRRAGDLSRRWKAQGRLNVRVFCIGGAAAGSPEQVDRSIQQIARMKLFQGDDYIDDVVFGESVYTPLHDRMFATKSDPTPDQLAQWRRMAMEIAKAGLPLHVHAELHDTIDAFLDQIEAVNKEYPIRNLRWALAHVNQINASQLERMKKLGMYAAVHPWAVINGGIMHEGFGDGAYDMPPLATIQNSGITWGFGTDGSAANQYLPFTTLYFAVTGKMAGGAESHSPDDQPRGRADRAHAQECVLRVPGEQPGLDPAGQAGRPGGARSRLPHDSGGPDQGHQAGDDDGGWRIVYDAGQARRLESAVDGASTCSPASAPASPGCRRTAGFHAPSRSAGSAGSRSSTA